MVGHEYYKFHLLATNLLLKEMISWRESNSQGADVLDISSSSYVRGLNNVPHIGDGHRHSGLNNVPHIGDGHRHSGLNNVPHIGDGHRHSETCMLQEEDERLINDVICPNNALLLKETCPSCYDRDYVEKIKEFQFYVDTVKKIMRPGCSPEMLNVALSSMSSLVKALSMTPSKL